MSDAYAHDHSSGDSSINGVIMQLIISFIMTVVFVTVFNTLRNTPLGKPVYSPRIINIPEESPPYCESVIEWFKSLFKYDNSFILDNISLDSGRVLMNFYKMGIFVCLISSLIICPILTSLDYYSHNEEFIIRPLNNTLNSTISENSSSTTNLNSRNFSLNRRLVPLNIKEDENYYYYTFSKREGEGEGEGEGEIEGTLDDPSLNSSYIDNNTEIIKTGLNMSIDVFSISNVPDNSKVLIAHAVCCYLYSFLVMFFLWWNYKIYKEYYQENIKKGGVIRTRAIKSEILQSKTIMIRNLPNGLQDKTKLMDWFNSLKVGKVQDIHIIRGINSKLASAVLKRTKVLNNLEKAYLSYKNNIDKNAHEKNFVQRFIEKKVLKKFPNALNNLFGSSDEPEDPDPEVQKMKKLRKLRPHHFAGKLYPLEGKFVDSISTYERELKELTEEIIELRKDHNNENSRAFSAFVTFKDARAAQIVTQLKLYSSDNTNTMQC
eukprot:jgi/Orpsp1_1/1183891/evm.model.c7180000087131.1